MKNKKHSKLVGSSFDSWLDEQGEAFKADVIAGAMKRQFVLKLRELMDAQGLGVNALQKKWAQVHHKYKDFSILRMSVFH